jgi:hypothetical protein
MAASAAFGDANSGLQAGVINGPVNNPQFHHHAVPGRFQKDKGPNGTGTNGNQNDTKPHQSRQHSFLSVATPISSSAGQSSKMSTSGSLSRIPGLLLSARVASGEPLLRVPKLGAAANHPKANRSLLSNMRIIPTSEHQIHGYSGSTSATLHVSSKAFEISQVTFESPARIALKPIYSSLCTTGYVMKATGNGFLYLVMSMTPASFWIIPSIKAHRQTPYREEVRAHSCRIFRDANTGLF